MLYPYVHIYADKYGETHIKHKNIPMKLSNFAPKATKLDISKNINCKSFSMLHFDNNWKSGWHTTPYNQWIFILSGSTKITVSDGEYCIFTPNTLMLLEDENSKGHFTEILKNKDLLCISIKI
jgi:hypothetical protein